jgi:hypothetical protein
MTPSASWLEERRTLLAFLRSRPFAVVSTVTPEGRAQSATVGVTVSDAFEVVFDTLSSTRKFRNLAQNSSIAITFGGLDAGSSRTVQLDGDAELIENFERSALVAIYIRAFPDGIERQTWPGLVYYRVRPRWLRDSDYAQVPPRIVEYTAAELTTSR